MHSSKSTKTFHLFKEIFNVKIVLRRNYKLLSLRHRLSLNLFKIQQHEKEQGFNNIVLIFSIGFQCFCLLVNRIVLHCQVEGTEPISVIWLKNQTILSSVTNDIQYDRGSATLHLVDVQINDSAYYTCRASNSFGTTETSAYLIVQSKFINFF